VSKRLRLVFVLYLIALYLVLAVAVVKSDFLERVWRRLGSPPPEMSDYYQTMLAMHLRIDPCVPPGSVLFVGDSIMQGLCVSAVADGAVNYGIGWDTTVGVLRRVRQYRSPARCRAVVLAVGHNDLGRRSNAEILANYEAILSAIPPHVPVVVSAVLPTDQSATGHKRNARIADLNEGLARLCAARGRCYWVDSAAKLVDAAGNLDLRYHDGDGVHLSQAGYAVWMADLRTALAAAAL